MRATLLSNRATTRTKVNQYNEALVDITTSLDLYPSSFKALRTRARIYLHLEQYDACVADFKQSLEQARMEAGSAEVRGLQDELRKAETALKRSKTKDYYKILGAYGVVFRSADTGLFLRVIGKVYRRESLVHHSYKVRCPHIRHLTRRSRRHSTFILVEYCVVVVVVVQCHVLALKSIRLAVNELMSRVVCVF